MNARGVLRCNREPENKVVFLPAYQWMSEQMATRIGPAPKGVAFPLWVWIQWESDRPRPDLRSLRHYWYAQGVQAVMLECEIPDRRVLASDFDMWHAVLNNWYIPVSAVDDEDTPYQLVSDDTKRASWAHIFDLSGPARWYWNGGDQDQLKLQSVQGCVWEIHLDEVRKVTHFTGAWRDRE